MESDDIPVPEAAAPQQKPVEPVKKNVVLPQRLPDEKPNEFSIETSTVESDPEEEKPVAVKAAE